MSPVPTADGDDTAAPATDPAITGEAGARALREALAGAGQLGADLLAVDWSASPVGPMETWPRTLSVVLQVALSSKFSIWLGWGPELVFFCNDAYRRDTLGTKYPWALGRPAKEVWAEIWPDLQPRVDQVFRGEATWDEGLLLFLERSGYQEETYHTFSYSPLPGDDGMISGLLCVVSEETERVIGQRRLATLSNLGAVDGARSEDETVAATMRHLEGNTQDFPFALTYLVSDRTARLAGRCRVPESHPGAPLEIDLDDDTELWPIAAALSGGPQLVHDLDVRAPGLPSGAWAQPPATAMVLPLHPQGGEAPAGVLIAGLNRYRPLSAGYTSFLELVAGQLAAGLASARAYETERRRAEQLAELDAAKTAFFTNVSHEFRTPLTLLLGPAEDALVDQDSPLPGAQRERVEVIHRNGQRLLKLVNSLLDFSRLEAGRMVAAFEPVSLDSETTALAETFRVAVERAGLSFTVECSPLPQPVYVDREMWAKVVLNLLSNALKFTFTGGITLRLQATEAGAVLTVGDTGIGLSETDQQHLFERFSRVSGARSRSHEGSGIGLALVAELSALHGGTVSVASTPEQGSTFTVVLPFGRDHLPGEQIRSGGQPTGTDGGSNGSATGTLDDGGAGTRDDGDRREGGQDVAAARSGDASPVAMRQAEGYLSEALRWLEPASGSGAPAAIRPAGSGDPDAPRVLVVDDNADMRDYIAQLLAGRYRVSVAADGAAALRAALDDPPDLVLTDVMMPELDGFGLLAALRADPRTSEVSVVMLSARAGEDGTIEGLEAGADDYLTKPFAARELLARVRANLELDRAQRVRTRLERSQELLDQAQRLARLGSWELDLATGAVTGSTEYFRLLALSPHGVDRDSLEAIRNIIHPDDAEIVDAALTAAAQGAPLDLELRLLAGGAERLVHAVGEVRAGPDGSPRYLRGSLQDITAQRAAERQLAAAAGDREAARREHRIADELQRSLLPQLSFSPEHLHVAVFYRAGVAGTQVGGDWYDVIELGAGRTALVMGDVMGRGVRAAAVMGQLRSAVRAYARLDLAPADLLEYLDGAVRELDEDSIVTCLYAVYDPADRSLRYATAGHLPPLLLSPGGKAIRLEATASAPLGTGPLTLSEHTVHLEPGALVALYTDGLVEHRATDLDAGIDALAAALEDTPVDRDLTDRPAELVAALLPEGPDDDIAVLLARVPASGPQPVALRLPVADEARAVSIARHVASDTFAEWGLPEHIAGEVSLLVSELVTNAVLHGRPPIELRLRRSRDQLVAEVADNGAFLPRRLRPGVDDEHGRGLQLVALLADRWGVRPDGDGKSVWFLVCLPEDA